LKSTWHAPFVQDNISSKLKHALAKFKIMLQHNRNEKLPPGNKHPTWSLAMHYPSMAISITNAPWSHLHINFLFLLLPKIVQLTLVSPFSWPSTTSLEVLIYLEHALDS